MFRLSEKGEQIQQMFGAIAPRYDFLNRLLSFGIDRRWRKTAVRLVKFPRGDVFWMRPPAPVMWPLKLHG